MSNSLEQDKYFMSCAYALARHAGEQNEVPVGAVLVYQNEIIAEGWNHPIQLNDPTAHAEMIALRQGADYLGNYRLIDTTLYVTLEPCVMCAGAMVHARVQRLVFAAEDPRAGAVQNAFRVLEHPSLNHRVHWQGGVMAESCSALLKDFFRLRR